ncbi:MAG: DegT/DnrJ/EryC1/StrS family aminotransferase [Nitrospinae bacterium]|nr:DegT/DnrJ/EryC1/StrS family aminotransferase [Nitrospinota bacterium]MBF0634777.1 DegT/DnrJ/EryC1/StrS family aminotransferase [Nitrospinota bacterium]
MIPLAPPALGREEIEALKAVIDSGWITMGERVLEFEKRFAQLHGAGSALAVDSCTAGLHLALSALGIGPGDEVLVPSLTFVATVNVAIYAQAVPVFVDVQSEDVPHISIADAQRKITPKTRAVIVMHYAGYLADMDAWRDFADRNSIALIEDAAHAPGVEGVGLKSDASAFSFFSNKNITTAEGGMVLARDPKVLERIKLMRSHGMTASTLDRHKGRAYSYDVMELGYNYRMDELRAAIGLVQLARLMEWNERRRSLTALYRSKLARIDGVRVPFGGWAKTAAHIMPVLLPQGVNRSAVIDEMRKRGVQTSVHYPPAHLFTYHSKRFPGVSLPLTERFCATELTLPLYPGLADGEVGLVATALEESLKAVR